MYLKALEIFGFKSFPEKTSLTFEPGITVVVGPNGCGKSNVFDSIKWALGEQSPKSLRGTKMEDIIFNGTENIPPLSYAEVALVFCNEDKYLPIDYKEVSVARRLYRDGESQYFINKNPVRLKDVEELFMGTGIGESTYSFVEQGKIEIFLSYKPEDKRLIFDEASGIIKYKERKKETLRQLETAQENLLRLDDIISEVRRQIRYLDRQVEKARKYKEVQERLIEVEKTIATLDWQALQLKAAAACTELEDARKKEEEKQAQVTEANSRWESLNQELKRLRLELEKAGTRIVTLKASIENSRRHIVVNEQRIKELSDRSQNLELSDHELSERLAQQEARNAQEEARCIAIKTELEDLGRTTAALSTEKEGLLAGIDETKKKVSAQKTSVLDWEQTAVKLRNSLIEMSASVSSLENRKRRLVLDGERLKNLLEQASAQYREASEGVEQKEQQVRQLLEKRTTLQRAEEELDAAIERDKARRIEKEKEVLELSATYEFLKDLRFKYETFSETRSVTVIFDEEPGDINKLVASLQGVQFERTGGVFKARLEVKVISFEERQLEEKIAAAKAAIDALQHSIEEQEDKRSALIKDLTVENARIDEEKRVLQEHLQRKETLTREKERLEEEAGILNEEQRTTIEDISATEERKKQLEGELAACQEKLHGANEELAACQALIAAHSQRIQTIDVEQARLVSLGESLHKEQASLQSALDLFKAELISIQNGIERIRREKEENSTRGLSLEAEIGQLRVSIGEQETEIAERSRERATIEEQEAQRSGESQGIQQELQRLEKESQELQASTYNKKLELQGLDYEKGKVKDYLRQVYNVELDLDAHPVEAGSDPSVLRTEKETLQKKVQSLGEVNLVAIEEFEELKKREEFLDTQKQDLITSSDNLKKAIAKINKQSRDLFIDTFTKIQQEFKKNFKFLFNGGNADLILVDPENVLESGVEIEVQPPGKKLQNVSLLSGGEKALTATALIFAIFTVRPSPLCVLDEIDAPLDEANVDRFNHILKQFAQTSQFVVITHNKKTMSTANVLYGVTMQEKGVSKLVSVKFAAEAEQAPAA